MKKLSHQYEDFFFFEKKFWSKDFSRNFPWEKNFYKKILSWKKIKRRKYFCLIEPSFSSQLERINILFSKAPSEYFFFNSFKSFFFYWQTKVFSKQLFRKYLDLSMKNAVFEDLFNFLVAKADQSQFKIQNLKKSLHAKFTFILYSKDKAQTKWVKRFKYFSCPYHKNQTPEDKPPPK